MQPGAQTVIGRLEEFLRSAGAVDAQLTAAWLLLAGTVGLLVFLLCRRRLARER
jgi:hypothetical protein